MGTRNLRRWGRDSMMWGVLPDWFWVWPTKFCEWAVLPHLKWLGRNVIFAAGIMAHCAVHWHRRTCRRGMSLFERSYPFSKMEKPRLLIRNSLKNKKKGSRALFNKNFNKSFYYMGHRVATIAYFDSQST